MTSHARVDVNMAPFHLVGRSNRSTGNECRLRSVYLFYPFLAEPGFKKFGGECLPEMKKAQREGGSLSTSPRSLPISWFSPVI